MRHLRVSAPWLSDDMAHALAAICPPLTSTDVVGAADTLTAGVTAPVVIDHLLRQGADLMMARQIFEALGALRDARVTDSRVAGWVLARETRVDKDAPDVAAAAERVCQKLGPDLARLVSPVGGQALLARALHVARARFPFLAGVRAGVAPDPCLQGLSERLHDIDAAEAASGMQAMLGVLIDLLVGVIGGDLTTQLVRGVWPDLPAGQPGRSSGPDGRAS